jgi:hypothetical protein
MTARVITNSYELDQYISLLRNRPFPMTVTVETGKRRSVEQNKLQRAICKEVGEQLGESPEDVRAYIKLHIGVPILRAENADFAKVYDRVIWPLPYADKIEIMKVPIDLPVTRLMTVQQKTRFLNEAIRHYAANGVVFGFTEKST